jgi:hypothetical protein
MSEDPLAVLEEAVREVESALLERPAVGDRVAPSDTGADAGPTDYASAEAEAEADDDAAPGPADRLAALEKEREAVRQRLVTLRDRLTLIAETTPEPSDP